MVRAAVKTEILLFERYAQAHTSGQLPLLFIVGAPRTGSTLAYQLMTNAFKFYYFSNFVTEYFAEYPTVGAALDLMVNPGLPVNLKSTYGKTASVFGPSEASNIFKNWYGGKHPSQIYSAQVLPNKEAHMRKTLDAIYHMAERPIAIKNAWNCFRIKDLCSMFSGARFLWIRRDIVKSAISDLEARYQRGSAAIWNSATTSNYQEIQKLPYWEQVVEQQFSYNKTLERDLKEICPDGFIQVWYEDMCKDAGRMVKKMEGIFSSWGWKLKSETESLPQLVESPSHPEMKDDLQNIIQYVKKNMNRFYDHLYEGRNPEIS